MSYQVENAVQASLNLQISPKHDASGQGVFVAVFDTWPPPGQIEAANDRINGGGLMNARLQQAVYPGIVSHVYNRVPAALEGGLPCGRYLPSDPVSGTPGIIVEDYDMSDHGLFVSDVINDMAPAADIEVYRVLTNGGTGDLDLISRAVQEALDYVRQNQLDDGLQQPRPLVLNFSLGLAPQALLLGALLNNPGLFYLDAKALTQAIDSLVPPAALPPGLGEPPGGNTEVGRLRSAGFVAPGENRFAGALGVVEKVFSFGRMERVLAVAAAGNDSAGDARRFGPRLPAAVEGVMAVAATVGDTPANQQPASYSNIDDFFSDSDGIAAFGGEAENDSTDPGPNRAMVGLYVSDNIPPNKPPATNNPSNDTGWAIWSGTSFAAPVVAGFAAALWSEAPNLSALEIRNLIFTDPHTRRDRQVLPFVQG